MFYYEYYLLALILLPGLILAIYAQTKLQTTFNKYSEIVSNNGQTAKDVARLFLDTAGLTDIEITRTRGHLTDHYNHRKKRVALSESVYDNSSISAIGVACHEVGHALQYKSGYFPIKLRNFIIPICNFANRTLWFFMIFGALLIYTNIGITFLWIGAGIFALSVLFNLITLPVEYNASKRAIALLEQSTVFDETEVAATKKVLNAAALTYVAALVVSILELLRILLIILKHSSRNSRD